ncbi:type I methionyl aminopeptidase [Roseateles sp. BYS180W]|uniref:Methionine aminopeptidase n=1 Tax=Roseateles rivi TaxID=3299028 RepID=A0ABW7FVJ4_9BURK
MTVGSEADVAGLRAAGHAVASVLQRMLAAARPGMSTEELDDMGGQWLAELGAVSAPKHCYDFPGYTCISLNEVAAHGVPGKRLIKKGDVLNVDVSAVLDGYYGDTGATILIPPVTGAKQRLVDATRQALAAAMGEARAGAKLNRIGAAIERVAQSHGFEVIRNLCSHGVGRFIHEEPESIPGYYDPHDQRVLQEGMVITIEPFLSTRADWVHERSDGWSLAAPRGNLSAQFEHSMIITRGAPIVLTELH